MFREENFDEDEEDYVEDPYDDSLSAAIAESAALAERERNASQAGSSADVKKRKMIKKDSYFSDEEDSETL